jgi:hypothetical protein
MKESRKFMSIKEIPSKIGGWEDFETIPKGAICEAIKWRGSDTIEYKGKKVCDTDSIMAKDYFVEIDTNIKNFAEFLKRRLDGRCNGLMIQGFIDDALIDYLSK